MLVIGFLEQFKIIWLRFKKNLVYNVTNSIIFVMLVYWILGNVILFSLFGVFINSWEISSGFNLGFSVSLIGFLFLLIASKWFFGKKVFKQFFAFLIFFFRIVMYGIIISLVLYFKFTNLISVVCGLSILMLASITRELIFIKSKKEL